MDDFTKSVHALVYSIDPEHEEMQIAYPAMPFNRNITDGRAIMCSVLTLSIGNYLGMGNVDGEVFQLSFTGSDETASRSGGPEDHVSN